TDDCKQPLALFLRVYVVCEGPKLRNDNEVEKSDPKEENNSKRDLHLSQRVKDHKIRYEKRDDTIDQSQPVYTAGDRAIDRDEKQQQQRLTCPGIALDLGARSAEDQRLPNRLDDVVGRQQDKDIYHQEKGC